MKKIYVLSWLPNEPNNWQVRRLAFLEREKATQAVLMLTDYRIKDYNLYEVELIE